MIASNYAVKKPVVKKNMHIFPFIDNALEYIKASKGIVGPAGYSTISEALVYDKPILVIPIRNHIEQLVNSLVLKREGLGISGIFKSKINPTVMKLFMNHFFENDSSHR